MRFPAPLPSLWAKARGLGVTSKAATVRILRMRIKPIRRGEGMACTCMVHYYWGGSRDGTRLDSIIHTFVGEQWKQRPCIVFVDPLTWRVRNALCTSALKTFNTVSVQSV